jgi:hypothetical protein
MERRTRLSSFAAVMATALLMLLAFPQNAGAEIFVSPSISVAGGQSMACRVLNVDPRRSQEVEIQVLDAGDSPAPNGALYTLAPFQDAHISLIGSGTESPARKYCYVRTSSSRKVKVVFEILDLVTRETHALIEVGSQPPFDD